MKGQDLIRCPWCLKVMSTRWYPRHIGRCPKGGSKLAGAKP